MGNVSCRMKKSSLGTEEKECCRFSEFIFLEDILMFEKRLDKCIYLKGNYVEKFKNLNQKIRFSIVFYKLPEPPS